MGEFLAETGFALILLATMLCVAIIFGLSGAWSDTNFYVVAMLACTFISFVVLVYHNMKRKNETITQKAYIAMQKTFPHGFSGTEDIFSSLAPIIENISINNNELCIEYGDDTFKATESKNKFTAFFNETEINGLSALDIIELALEFAHNKRKDIEYLVISDSQLKGIKDGYITYADTLERIHSISLSECFANFGTESIVGFKDPDELYCIFHTGAVKTLVSFDIKIENIAYKRRSRKEKTKSYEAFIAELNQRGYTLKDIRGTQ